MIHICRENPKKQGLKRENKLFEGFGRFPYMAAVPGISHVFPLRAITSQQRNNSDVSIDKATNVM